MTDSITELRTMFASDDTADYRRMRRLAVIITLRMTDRIAANHLQEQLEAAIELFENVREDGRMALAMAEDDLVEAARLS